jgi:hypothetical protein
MCLSLPRYWMWQTKNHGINSMVFRHTNQALEIYEQLITKRSTFRLLTASHERTSRSTQTVCVVFHIFDESRCFVSITIVRNRKSRLVSYRKNHYKIILE